MLFTSSWHPFSPCSTSFCHFFFFCVFVPCVCANMCACFVFLLLDLPLRLRRRWPPLNVGNKTCMRGGTRHSPLPGLGVGKCNGIIVIILIHPWSLSSRQRYRRTVVVWQFDCYDSSNCQTWSNYRGFALLEIWQLRFFCKAWRIKNNGEGVGISTWGEGWWRAGRSRIGDLAGQ